MSQQFLLPCSCGQKLAVSPAQAGGQVVCSCGRTLGIPTLRGLRQLEIARDVAPAKAARGWSPVHGAVFAAGLVVAAVGLIVLALYGLQYGQIMGFRLTLDRADDVIRAEMARIENLSPRQALEEWNQEIEQGLGEKDEPPWSKYNRLAN